MDGLIEESFGALASLQEQLLRILTKLMECKDASAYIPGETLQLEQQRCKVMQYGMLPVLCHLINQSKVSSIVQAAAEHLCTCYPTPEIEWSLQMLHKCIDSTATDKSYVSYSYNNIYRSISTRSKLGSFVPTAGVNIDSMH